MFVQDVMTREPTTVTGATTLKHAAELLARLAISTMPVLDADGRVCGVVSEADLIRDAFAVDPRSQILHDQHTPRSEARYVAEVMTPHALTVHESTDVAQAAELMTSTGIKSVPVVDDDQRLVGVLSRSDLVRVRARADQDIEREVDSVLVSLGHGDWLVEVSEGAVEIDGPLSSQDRSLAEVVAGTVPGVVTVRVR
jgi:CBS domain-containing protein